MADSKMTLGPGTNPGIARKLASSERGTREKAICLLIPWLSCQVEIEEEELKRIWKGLFYCVWLSDKAPVQAELTEKLAGILETVEVELSVSFFKVFLTTMRREWGGIDRLRLDKFYLLIRKILSHGFKVLDKGGWEKKLVSKYMGALKERAFLATDRFPALGVNLHLIDIFWDELSKNLPVPDGTLDLLLDPFYSVLATSSDKALLKRVRENIFNPLSVDANSLISKIEKKQSLDGVYKSIGVLLHSTPVATRLFDLASDSSTPQANRRIIYELHEEFSKLAKSFDLLKGSNAFQFNVTSGSLLDVPVTEDSKNSRTRSRKRQAKGLDALSVEGVAVSKVKKPKKLKTEQEPVKGGSQDGNRKEPVRHVDHSRFDAKEEKEGKDRAAKKKRSHEASLITAKADFPLLQKISLKRKARKRKKGQSQLVQVDSLDSGLGTLVEPESGRNDRVLETNGHQNTSAQPPVVASDGAANGHQDINGVTMNLEKKFDGVAAGEPVQSFSSGDPASGMIRRVSLKSRKRKVMRESTAAQSTSLPASFPSGTANLPVPSPAPKLTAEADADGQTPEKTKKKKVRFVLRNNLISKPNAPLPPLSMRTPPSATPRGSALKSGVLPGPIRTRPIRVVRGTSKSKSRKRASRQLLTMSMQKPKNSTRKLRKRPNL